MLGVWKGTSMFDVGTKVSIGSDVLHEVQAHCYKIFRGSLKYVFFWMRDQKVGNFSRKISYLKSGHIKYSNFEEPNAILQP